MTSDPTRDPTRDDHHAHRVLRVVRAVAALLIVPVITTTLSFRAATAAPAAASVAPAPAPFGLTLLALATVGGNPRLLDATLATAALAEPVHVRVHLPAGYTTDRSRRYPTLYLLHGAGDGASGWTTSGQEVAIVDASPFQGIVVMPDAGQGGWYTDWVRPSRGGFRPQWETFHLGQLLPWIDAAFRTLPDRAHRAVAGLSMGGFGALAYGSRRPDLFSTVASFSGGADIEDPLMQQVVIADSVTLVHGAAITRPVRAEHLARDVQDVFGPYDVFGGTSWRRHNPFDLAAVFGRPDTRLSLYSGYNNPLFDWLEWGVGRQNDAFHVRLRSLGVPHRYCAGRGTHTWRYWQDDLRDFLRTTYGTSSGAAAAPCPNGWGNPRP